jgi:hypothetical protein
MMKRIYERRSRVLFTNYLPLADGCGFLNFGVSSRCIVSVWNLHKVKNVKCRSRLFGFHVLVL